MLRALVVLLLLVAAGAAGCIGKPDAPVKPASAPAPNATAGNATLPDGRGQSLGALETNKTENGTGGMQHMHDYWKGRESVVLFQEDVQLFASPVFPDGQGTNAKSVAYVKLPNTSLVYEGADKVTLLAKLADPRTPADPALHAQYRSAADSDWRDAGDLASEKPLDITVSPKETDMPHSVSSLWVFRITTDKPVLASSFNLTITAHKGRDVVNWPGHPDFYADSPVRTVANHKPVKTHMSGIAESQLYDQGGSWAAPDKLISYGTNNLTVIVNVTKAESQFGAPATGFFLEVHNATIIGPEVTFGDRYFEQDKKNDLKSYTFQVPVDLTGMDGPYQPASRWGFRLMATFADVDLPVIGDPGLCPGCFSYDVQYDLTVLAIHDPTAPAMAMMG